ncbi:MAG: homoserine kinase [Gammaproteobacteria bacterium]|nr:homoserine kinase [Gammaproteobacteria bacterium]
MALSIFAPVSIGNVSVGFDTLGLAITPIDGTLLGDVVSIKSAKTSSLKLSGQYVDKLPENPQDNIVWQCLLAFERVLSNLEIEIKPVVLTLDKKLPVGSGLGSSACSVVATLVALNKFYNEPLKEKELLRVMGQIEGKYSGSVHYDNVAPSFLGGLQLMLPAEQICQSLPVFEDCYWVMAYPDIVVSTKMAREILPPSFDKQVTINFGQNLAGFVDASHRKDKALAFALLKDVIAEPYRHSLLPDFLPVRHQLIMQGSLAVGISGSGPTIFSVCDNLDIAEQNKAYMQEHYLQSKHGFVHICKPDMIGAREIKTS